MANSNKSQKRAERELRKIQTAGFTAFAIGFVLLIAPAFLKSSKLLAPLATQLGSLAYWMIFIGIGLIGLYVLLKPKDENEEEYSSITKVEPKPLLQKQNKSAPNIQNKPNLFSKITQDLNLKFSRQWSKQVFADIEWRRFEVVCEAYYSQGNLKTKSQTHGADGGVDIWMYFDDPDKPVSIVQCKNFYKKEIGVSLMREFLGVMAANKLTSGQFVTSSTFTADAQKFAKQNGINAVDGDRLLKMILDRTPEQQKQLLDIAYKGDYSTPTCASCGIKLVRRTTFWGCSNYPRCFSRIYFKADTH